MLLLLTLLRRNDMTDKAMDERQQILQSEVNNFVPQGWEVTNQTQTTTQLVKPKEFSPIAIIALLLAALPFILYLLWSRRIDTLDIEVDEHGRIQKTWTR
jgi:hypothetical protein